VFWSLWEQSNGQTWTLQAQSGLLDKNLGFGVTVLPAQIQLANALFVLILTPLFSLGVYPWVERYVKVTPLRKIGVGLFVTAGSFLIVAWIEAQLQAGQRVSAWWQILAYAVLTTGEVLVSITALEFSYKQAPLRVKSFVMALFLLSISLGNLMTAGVNHFMVRALSVSGADTGAQTWLHTPAAGRLQVGQKIDFAGRSGVEQVRADGSAAPLEGTYLVAGIDAAAARVSTYALVGADYFLFFAAMMTVAAVLFIFVARKYREHSYVRDAGAAVAAP
jgi:POT family proton-dependent oligopeptide transporter